MTSLKASLFQLLTSEDPTNIHLGLSLLQNDPDDKSLAAKRQAFAANEPFPLPKDMLAELLYVYCFHLSIIDLSYADDSFFIRGTIKDLFEEITGVTPEKLLPNEGEFAFQIGSWEHYGGCDFCLEERFHWYMEELANNMEGITQVNAIEVAQVLTRSTATVDYCKTVGLAEVGKNYLYNYAPDNLALALLQNESPTQQIVLDGAYLANIPAWMGKVNALKIDLSHTTFVTYPNNFDLFPQLETLCLHDTRTSQSYYVGEYEGRNMDEAYVRFEQLPDSLATLQYLKVLDLSRTQLGTEDAPSVLPEWLAQLKNLETLCLPFCHLKTLPLVLQQLPKLKQLQIPLIDLEEGYKKVWGMRCYTNLEEGVFDSLGIEWFRGLLPKVEININVEILEEQSEEWEEGEEVSQTI